MRRRSTRSPLWKVPVDDEVREELEFHLEMRIREYREQGLDEAEARRRALERFGDLDRLGRKCRELARHRDRRHRLVDLISELRSDLAFGLRQLRRRPLLAAVMVGSLALGVAINLTGFRLVDRLLLSPPPFPDSERLVLLFETQESRGVDANVVGPANFMVWREENRAFESIAAFITVNANLSAEGRAERAQGRLVTEGWFELLGTPPSLGRTLLPDDWRQGARPVVVLSHALWQSRFGGRHDVVGDTLTIDGNEHDVVGVMPAGFGLDLGPTLSPYGDPGDFWWPLPISDAWRQPRGRWLMVVARLQPGVSAEQAAAEMDRLAARTRELHPDFDADWGAAAVPLQRHVTSWTRLPVTALYGAGALVLLLVSVNVGGLLVGRAAGRAEEFAIRGALGAGRGRLLRQLLVEGLLLVLLGVGLGAALSWLSEGALRLLLPERLLGAPTAGSGTATALYLILLAVVCTLVAALLPAWQAVRRPVGSGTSLRTGPGRGRVRLRRALVFAQVALAVVLLMGAGLILRSTQRLLAVDAGFSPERVLSFSVALPRGTGDAEIASFYQRLLERLTALPGVEESGAVSQLPIGGGGAATGYHPLDRAAPEPGQAPIADIRVVSGDYFSVMGIEPLAGRLLDDRDRPEAEEGSVLVSRSVAERHWPEGSALGQRLAVSWGDDRPRRIVGVVEDVRHQELESPPRDAIYLPHRQDRHGEMTVVVRGATPPETLAREARAIVTSLAPGVPVYDLRSLDQMIRGEVAEERFLARVLGLFAAFALVVAALGVYGILAFSVAQRTRELGVRMALGAAPREVRGLVLREAALLTLAALAVGVGAALALGRWLEALLFEVQPSDPGTMVAVGVVLALLTLAAAALPARRAARLDPVRALRAD